MKKQTMIIMALALTPPSLLYGQEHTERSHQHCHVEVEADCSNSLFCLAYSRKIVSTCPMLLVKLKHLISGNMEMNSKKLFSSPATIEPGHQCSTDIMPYTEDSTRNGSHRIGCKMKSGQGTGKTRILHTNLNTDCYTLLVL